MFKVTVGNGSASLAAAILTVGNGSVSLADAIPTVEVTFPSLGNVTRKVV